MKRVPWKENWWSFLITKGNLSDCTNTSGNSQTRMIRIWHDVRITYKGYSRLLEKSFLHHKWMQLLQNKKVHKRNIFPDSKTVEFIISCHTHTHTHTHKNSGVMNNLIMIYIMTKKEGKNIQMQMIKRHQLLYLRENQGLFTWLLYSPRPLLCECLIIVSGLNWTKLLDTKLNTTVNLKMLPWAKTKLCNQGFFPLNQPPLAGEFYGM